MSETPVSYTHLDVYKRQVFGNLSNDGLEQTQDRLGGFNVRETDVYEATIKVAYAGQSAGGARNVTLVVNLPDGEYSETIYVTNKKGCLLYTSRCV